METREALKGSLRAAEATQARDWWSLGRASWVETIKATELGKGTGHAQVRARWRERLRSGIRTDWRVSWDALSLSNSCIGFVWRYLEGDWREQAGEAFRTSRKETFRGRSVGMAARLGVWKPCLRDREHGGRGKGLGIVRGP